MIRKASRNDLAFISGLHRSVNRREQGLFLAEGEKTVSELLGSHIEIHSIACLSDYYDQNRAAIDHFEVLAVSESELGRISTLTTPNRVLAICKTPQFSEFSFISTGQTVLLLDNINDPGNMGTIIRTAEWFGVDAVFASPGSVDFWNPKVVQASMGSIFRMKVYQQPLLEVISKARNSKVEKIVGGVLGGENMSAFNRQAESVLLVVGSESHGISSEILSSLSHKLSIPRIANSPKESLNASVAAGIMLYHLCHN
ncbi:MAG: TrmH family RNA methyltransferase [Bacteroidota bacterium]